MVMKTFRVPEELWRAALAKADRDVVHLSDLIRKMLERYVGQP